MLLDGLLLFNHKGLAALLLTTEIKEKARSYTEILSLQCLFVVLLHT
jgi:hypothetical protein